jgi:predicted ferric reductase
MASALAFSVSVAALALWLLLQASTFHNDVARTLVRIGSVCVLASMSLSAIYAVAEHIHHDWLTIPRMASTHGWINALGFVMPVLLGYLIELRGHPPSDRTPIRKHTAPRRSPGCKFQRDRIAGPTFAANEFYDH